MRKILLVGSLILMFLISGCAVSDYLTGMAVEEDSYSLLDEEDSNEDEINELENLIEELDEEVVDEPTFDEGNPITLTIKENKLVSLKPKAKDADEDTLTYKFSEPLDETGSWKTNYGDAGEYLITVIASDGKLTTSKQVLLVVERDNVPPVITDVPATIEVDEGDILVLSPKAKDPNGDDVIMTISEPVGDTGEWAIGYQDAGEYTVKVTAFDGELESVSETRVTVKKKNVAPVIENVGDINVEEGDVIVLSPVVTDINGDDVQVTISDPIGDNGIWETKFTDNGVYTITIEANDGTTTTIKEITVTVADVNVAPVIEDIILN